jgi:hypothetical protein
MKRSILFLSIIVLLFISVNISNADAIDDMINMGHMSIVTSASVASITLTREFATNFTYTSLLGMCSMVANKYNKNIVIVNVQGKYSPIAEFDRRGPKFKSY